MTQHSIITAIDLTCTQNNKKKKSNKIGKHMNREGIEKEKKIRKNKSNAYHFPTAFRWLEKVSDVDVSSQEVAGLLVQNIYRCYQFDIMKLGQFSF